MPSALARPAGAVRNIRPRPAVCVSPAPVVSYGALQGARAAGGCACDLGPVSVSRATVLLERLQTPDRLGAFSTSSRCSSSRALRFGMLVPVLDADAALRWNGRRDGMPEAKPGARRGRPSSEVGTERPAAENSPGVPDPLTTWACEMIHTQLR